MDFAQVNIYFAVAAVLSFLTTLIHLFAGGREIAVPLLESRDIQPVPKYTMYYAWHLVTIMLFVMAVTFGHSAIDQTQTVLAFYTTMLAISFMLLSLGFVVWKKQKFWQMPQWFLFLVIAIFGVAGFWH